MKQPTRLFTLLTVGGAIVLLVGRVGAATFQVASGDWTNSANWNGGLPSATVSAQIGYQAAPGAVCTTYIHSADASSCSTLNLGGNASGRSGTLIMEGGSLGIANSCSLGDLGGATGVVMQFGGIVTNSATSAHSYIGNIAGGYGELAIAGGVFTNIMSTYRFIVGNNGEGRLTISGNGRFSGSFGRLSTGVGTGSRGTITIANGGRLETRNASATLYLAQGAGYGALIVTNGGVVDVTHVLSLAATTSSSTGLLYITSGGLFSNALTGANANAIGASSISSSIRVVVSNATFHADGNVNILNVTNASYPAALVELDGTQRVFRLGPSAVLTLGNAGTPDRQGIITNHIRQVAGGIEINNTGSGGLVLNTGSRIHLSFDENPVANGDFWGLKWAGTNGCATLVSYTNSGLITFANNLSAPFNTQPISVYTNVTGGVTNTYIGFYANVIANNPPVTFASGIATNLVSTNMNEDGGTLDLSALGLSATDDASGGAGVTWTNTTTPANGTVAVSGSGTNPATWTTFTYRPNTNFNGTNSFVMKATDVLGGSASITVAVVVAAINDPPVCSARPAVSGVATNGALLTASSGAWSDAADTNVSGSSTLTFGYEWQYSAVNDGTGVTSLNVYGPQYTVGAPVAVGNYVRVKVVCTNDGVGTPQYQVVTTNSDWVQVFSLNTAPTINQAGPLTTNMNEDGGTLNLAALTLTASDADGDNLTWTKVAGLGPSNGTVTVSGAGTNLVTWTSFTYTPNTNFNGTDSFAVQAVDGKGGYASVTVTVVVAAINDPPVNTVAPGITGTRLVNNTLTVTNGIWNDDADTNTTYMTPSFAFTYQWQRADDGSGGGQADIAGATAANYLLVHADQYKFVRVRVTCADAGYGTPASASNAAYTAWLQETSVVPAVVVFNKTSDNWGSYSNWTPDTLPATNIDAVIGDTVGASPATASINGSDVCGARTVYLGTNTGARGTLNLFGNGTLTGSGLLVGQGTNSVGLLSIAGTASVWVGGATTVGGGLGSTGQVAIGGGGLYCRSAGGDQNLNVGGLGWGSVVVTNTGYLHAGVISICGTNNSSEMLVGDNGVVSNLSYMNIANAVGSQGTLTLTNNARWTITQASVNIGNAANAFGRLYVRGGTFDSVNNRPHYVGSVAGSTGLVEVTGSGAITNAGAYTVGNLGQGNLYIRQNGSLDAGAISIAGTNNSCDVWVGDNGVVRNNGNLNLGNAVAAVGTLTLTNSARWSLMGGNLNVGNTNSAFGRFYLDGGNFQSVGRPVYVGAAVSGTGVVRQTSGVYSNSSGVTVVGYLGEGRFDLLGGVLYGGNGGITIGNAAGYVGTMQVAGGTWIQPGPVNLGANAGATGLLTVANTIQTNVTGAVTVGAAGYGLLTITNATFGGGTASAVGNGGTSAGIMELTGSGSVFRCNMLIVTNGGAVTNHVRLLAGGIDITNTASAALIVTNGGRIRLSFDAAPAVGGDFWGLRWAGTNGYAVLAACTNDGRITMTNNLSGAWSNVPITVYKAPDNSYTYVGFFVNLPPAIDQGAAISANMNEDGGTLDLSALGLTATDDASGGAGVTWTNATVPANGSVAVSGSGTNPVTWSAFTYRPNANFNGTDSFLVQAKDTQGATSSITVTVVVAAINDPPLCADLPTVSGFCQLNMTVTNDSPGAWNDALDTNVSGSSTFTFTRQWRTATDALGNGAADIPNATNATYTLTGAETGKYVCVQVTCTDDGVGTPAHQSATVSSVRTLVTAPNALPVIVNGAGPMVVTLAEDGGPTNLQLALSLGATDADDGAASLTWTNESQPAHGTVMVTGTGASPTTFMYVPNANWNGPADSFWVRVTDPKGGFARIRVDVTVSAVNDPPVNTVPPGVNGPVMVYSNVTLVPGVWNDAADTNAPQNGVSTLTLACQWLRADDGAGTGATDIPGATNATYTLQVGDLGKCIAVRETCVDTGAGEPGPLMNWAYSAWLQETSPIPTAVRFNKAADVWSDLTNWTPLGMPATNIDAYVGSAAYGDAAVTIGNGAAYTRTLYLGESGGQRGTLNVSGGILTGGRLLSLGDGASSTGIINQTGGTIVGYGSGVTVGNGASSYGRWTVGGTATVTNDSGANIGNGDGSVGTIVLTNNSTWTITGGALSIGSKANAQGRFFVDGGCLYTQYRPVFVGAAAGGTGLLRITSGVYSNSAGPTVVGSLGEGRLELLGGTLYGGTIATTVGNATGYVGMVQVSGGTWVQAAPLNVGGSPGATGLLTVANTIQTNITGTVTIGAAGYGLLTISNGLFGGATSVKVGSGGASVGCVQVAGSGSVLWCSTLAVTNGGYVTNHVRLVAGGIDVTNTANTALDIANGGSIRISFEQNPVAIGDFWGLRWAGNNHAATLQAFATDGRLTWDDSGLAARLRNKVGVYTNDIYTFFGFYHTGDPGTVYRFR